MAQYPCDYCGQRYRGPQQTAYPAVIDGTTRFSERRRACPSCFLGLLTQPWLSLVGGEERADRLGCYACDADSARWAVFMPIYANGEERADLYGRLCARCLTQDRLSALFGTHEAAQARLELA